MPFLFKKAKGCVSHTFLIMELATGKVSGPCPFLIIELATGIPMCSSFQGLSSENYCVIFANM